MRDLLTIFIALHNEENYAGIVIK